ncbi:MAG: hypothetical protein WA990_04155 [Rubrobacteraceae bacterium]
MKRLVYLAALSMVAVLVFASAALAQGTSSVQDPDNCPADTRAVGDANGFTGCVSLEELCDAETLTASQYAECIATPEEITAGSGGGIPEYVPGYAPGASTLPDTGGPSVLLAGGVLVSGTGLLGLALLRKRAS